MSDQPSWLAEPPPPPPTTSAPPPPNSFVSNAPVQNQFSSSASGAQYQGQENDPDPPRYKKAFNLALMIINLGLSCMMAATGVLGIMASDSTSDTGVIFMGLYMLIFALILAVFEISQLRPSMGIDNLWKRNFGFLYGPIGRGIYMIFIAILCFGIEKPYDLALASGIVIIIFGSLQIFVSLWYPRYFDKKDKYQP